MFTHYADKNGLLERTLLHSDNGNFKVYNLVIKQFDSLTSLCFFLCRIANNCDRHSLNTNHFPSHFGLDLAVVFTIPVFWLQIHFEKANFCLLSMILFIFFLPYCTFKLPIRCLIEEVKIGIFSSFLILE